MIHSKTIYALSKWLVGPVFSVLICSTNAAPSLACQSVAGLKPVESEVAAGAVKFDELAVGWQSDRAKMLRGLSRAEAFRKTLLKSNAGEPSQASLIGAALEKMRRTNPVPLVGRPGVSRFEVTASKFVEQLRGAVEIDAANAFQAFSGRWYGVWNQQRVNHHWHDVVVGPSKSLAVEPEQPKLTGLQYAWIGDGFGWNYLAQPEHSTGQVLVGFVHHLQPYEPKTIRSDFPLVGYQDSASRLIWVTSNQIFFEEVIGDTTPDAPLENETMYAITGFDYVWNDGKFTASQSGFQAIYSRTPDDRPEFRKFDWKP